MDGGASAPSVVGGSAAGPSAAGADTGGRTRLGIDATLGSKLSPPPGSDESRMRSARLTGSSVVQASADERRSSSGRRDGVLAVIGRSRAAVVGRRSLRVGEAAVVGRSGSPFFGRVARACGSSRPHATTSRAASGGVDFASTRACEQAQREACTRASHPAYSRGEHRAPLRPLWRCTARDHLRSLEIA